MSVKETLENLIDNMPDQRLREMLHFAEFLNWQHEREESREFGRAQLERAYGADEPEYTIADLKSETEA